jgi:hypothetical protein
VQLEERARQAFARGDERAAADAAHLLAAEDGNGARSDALYGLDRSHDAERSVEAAALRHRVEM